MFFGQPSSTKAPPKQSKLSFSSKSSRGNGAPSSSAAKENEDIEDEGSSAEIQPVARNEYVDANKNVNSGRSMLHNLV